MHIVINGKETEQPAPLTVLALLNNKELDPATVVVELNREILPGKHFGATMLQDGNKLEILRFVGGG